jgi:hypothetical protein
MQLSQTCSSKKRREMIQSYGLVLERNKRYMELLVLIQKEVLNHGGQVTWNGMPLVLNIM